MADMPAPVLDGATIDELVAMLGAEKTALVARMFLSRMAELTPIFRDNGDLALVRRANHDLISLAGNIGCSELVSASRDLSAAIRLDAEIKTARAALVDAASRAVAAVASRFPGD